MKTICIDIDGTICRYSEWINPHHFGEILPNAQEIINKLHEDGWYIIIFSTRSDKEIIKDFLIRNNIYFDSINNNPYQPQNAVGGKPLADIYLDDRAITFMGNWIQTYAEIVNFKPWEKQIGK